MKKIIIEKNKLKNMVKRKFLLVWTNPYNFSSIEIRKLRRNIIKFFINLKKYFKSEKSNIAITQFHKIYKYIIV